MKRLSTYTLATLTALTIAFTSISAPAHAGKRERQIAAGVLFGAIGGAIIAGEINRKKRKKRARRYHREHRTHGTRRQFRQHRTYRATRPNGEFHQQVRPRLSRWERHVARCEARYRTYDRHSDTFIGNDGYEYKCRL